MGRSQAEAEPDLCAVVRAARMLAASDGGSVGDGSPEAVLALRDRARDAGLLPDATRNLVAWERAWRRVVTEERERSSRAGLGWLLTSLAGGTLHSADVLEVGSETLRLTRVTSALSDPGADPHAEPCTDPHAEVLAEASWRECCQDAGADVLPAARALRLLMLAGAGTVLNPSDLGAALDRGLASFLDRAGPRHDPLVMVVGAVGWAPVEGVADRARPGLDPLLQVRVPAGASGSSGVLLAGMPLRRALWLAAAQVDGASGRIDVVRRCLFPAGSTALGRPGALPRAEASVTGPPGPGDSASCLAAVVTGGTDEPPNSWRAVRIDQLDLPSGTAATLRYRLHGPGRVDLVQGRPQEVQPGSWAGMVRGLPRRLARPRPVDLVLAVELGVASGLGEAALAERLQDARAALAAIQGALGDEEGALLVGLIGYGDHAPLDGPRQRDPLAQVLGLSLPGTVDAALADLRPVPLQHDFAAPLEHVPEELERWHGHWRHDSHRVLLVVGSRPPHPHVHPPETLWQRAPVRICPDRLDWADALARLRRDDALACLALVEEPPWMNRSGDEPYLTRWADEAWDAIGAHGRFRAGEDPERIARIAVGPARSWSADDGPVRLVLAAGEAEPWLPDPVV